MHDDDAPLSTSGDFLLAIRDRVRARLWQCRSHATYLPTQPVVLLATSSTGVGSLAHPAKVGALEIGGRWIT